MNMSEEIFGPDVRTFNPERWLGPDSKQLGEHSRSTLRNW